MRSIIEIAPARGDGRFSPWIDISDRITGSAKIRHQYESSGWNYGVAAVSFSKLTCENDDGLLSPADDHRSVFADSSIGDSRLRVRYGGTADNPARVVFLGFVSPSSSEADIKRKQSKLTVSGIGAALRSLDAAQSLGWTTPRTRDSFVNDIFALPRIRRFAGGDPPEILFVEENDRGDRYEISHEIIGRGDTVLTVLNKFLQIEDAVLLYNYRRSSWIICRRGLLPSPATVFVSDILEVLSSDDGSKKTRNEIRVRTPGGETEILRNDVSVSTVGQRAASMDASFVSAAYYADRIKAGFDNGSLYPQLPRKTVTFTVDADNPSIPEHWWGLGEYVYLSPRAAREDAVTEVSSARPANPTELRRDVFDPRVPRDDIGVLGKWKFRVRHGAADVITLFDARGADLTNEPLRLSADGLNNPPFGYLGQIRCFRPTTGRPNWSARIALTPDPGAESASEILAAGPHFDVTYLPDVRWEFLYRGTSVAFAIPAAAHPDPYSVIPAAPNPNPYNLTSTSDWDAFMNRVSGDSDHRYEIEIAATDVKARNIDAADVPATVIIGDIDEGARAPAFVGFDSPGEDVTTWRS